MPFSIHQIVDMYDPNTMSPKLLIIGKIYSSCVWFNHFQTWELISLVSHMFKSISISYLVMYVALMCRSMACSNCITNTFDKARSLNKVSKTRSLNEVRKTFPLLILSLLCTFFCPMPLLMAIITLCLLQLYNSFILLIFRVEITPSILRARNVKCFIWCNLFINLIHHFGFEQVHH